MPLMITLQLSRLRSVTATSAGTTSEAGIFRGKIPARQSDNRIALYPRPRELVAIPSAPRSADRTLIGCATTALDGVARRTAVPSTPSASAGTSIRRTVAALHRITRWAAVPGLPAIAVTVRWRRWIIILSIRWACAVSDCCANQGTCQHNRTHGKAPSSLEVR
jgi:hypothetical protein